MTEDYTSFVTSLNESCLTFVRNVYSLCSFLLANKVIQMSKKENRENKKQKKRKKTVHFDSKVAINPIERFQQSSRLWG